MQDILQLLSDSDTIKDFEILSLLQEEDFYYLKIRSVISDGSLFHVKIFLSKDEYNYSFHWQKETGELIVRWDNAPHHRDIRTYPHHKHIASEVRESFDITLDDILKRIEEHLNLS